MANILEPQQVHAVSTQTDRDAQLDRIDALLEKYLHLLHDYQAVRKQLSESLASGFFSLAQANFQNSNRTRYGQDHYDERMQAVRKVIYTPADEGFEFEIVPQRTKPTVAAADADPPDNDNDDDGDKPEGPNPSEATPGAATPRDPLRWFGILVPSSLRAAQSSFQVAVDGPVPRLANLSKEMRALEVEISRLRKSVKKVG